MNLYLFGCFLEINVLPGKFRSGRRPDSDQLVCRDGHIHLVDVEAEVAVSPELAGFRNPSSSRNLSGVMLDGSSDSLDFTCLHAGTILR